MIAKTKREPAADSFMSISAVQLHLGGLSRTTIDAMIKRGDLTAVQMGRRRLISRQSITDYVARAVAKANANAAKLRLRGGL